MSEVRKIIIKPKDKVFIKRKFNVSMSAIYKAMSFQHEGVMSRRIRSYAANHLKCYLI